MEKEYNPDLILTQEHTEEEIRNFTGSFCGFVLLEERQYDLTALAKRLEQKGLVLLPSGTESAMVQDLMLDVAGAMVTISYFGEKIPDGEAEMAAQRAKWTGAESAAQNHKGHLMIAVLPDALSAKEAGRLYSQILSVALEDAQALAVYTSGTIFGAQQFCQKNIEAVDALPLDNLIFIDTYTRAGGTCGYTVGMDAFGKDELEVLDCTDAEDAVFHILQSYAEKILQEDLSTQWYITLVIDGAIWEGRRKDGVMVEGHSLQLQRA